MDKRHYKLDGSGNPITDKQQQDSSYVLITAAFNEKPYIETVVSAVLGQVLRPARWVIVSDRSVDGTDEIVKRYSTLYPFIELLRLNGRPGRSFASKAYALNAAAEVLRTDRSGFIGHLDADVSFDSTYMYDLLQHFALDPKLGIAGGAIYERKGNEFKPRRENTNISVAGAVQMFRRECYESIGGILPLSGGREDTYAEVTARMNGWRVVSFPELKVRHHRPTGDEARRLRYWYGYGRSDCEIGVHPVFEVLRTARRLSKQPFVIGAMALLWGFAAGHCRRERRMVSPEFVRFLRAEQMSRLWPFRRRE